MFPIDSQEKSQAFYIIVLGLVLIVSGASTAQQGRLPKRSGRHYWQAKVLIDLISSLRGWRLTSTPTRRQVRAFGLTFMIFGGLVFVAGVWLLATAP